MTQITGPGPGPFHAERARAVALCLRIDERSGPLSVAALWPQRSQERADQEAARAAEASNREDQVLLSEFVRWGLEHHASAMCAWAESAAVLGCTESYVRGWEQVLAAWRSGEAEPEGPEFSLAWLVSLWSARKPEGS